MDCPDYKEQIALLLTGGLDERQSRGLEKHLEGCPDCRAELETSRKLWDLMGEIPDPAPPSSMRTRFNIALSNFTEENTLDKRRWSVTNIFRQDWLFRPRLQFGYGILLLCIGFLAGYLLTRRQQTPVAPQNMGFSQVQPSTQTLDSQPIPDTGKLVSSKAASSTVSVDPETPMSPPNSGSSHMPVSINRQIDSLSAQVSEMKQMMMLSLLENPSASQRIRAVGYTGEIGNTNKKVIDALFTTLNEDPNVNVRLITLEALSKFSNDPSVREGLVQSITQQESPLLQSAIADVMVKLQEKRSIKPLQKLLLKKDINEMVKLKIEQSIQKLI